MKCHREGRGRGFRGLLLPQLHVQGWSRAAHGFSSDKVAPDLKPGSLFNNPSGQVFTPNPSGSAPVGSTPLPWAESPAWGLLGASPGKPPALLTRTVPYQARRDMA